MSLRFTCSLNPEFKRLPERHSGCARVVECPHHVHGDRRGAGPVHGASCGRRYGPAICIAYGCRLFVSTTEMVTLVDNFEPYAVGYRAIRIWATVYFQFHVIVKFSIEIEFWYLDYLAESG